MVPILFAMLLIVLMAGLVVLYVAYPHRGEDVPNAPWVTDALRRGVAKLPTLDSRPDRQLDSRLDSTGDEQEPRYRPERQLR